MYSTIFLYSNLPLGSNNYIIDNIEDYLNQYQYYERQTQIIYIKPFQELYLKIDNNLIETFKKYNYAKIVGANNYGTAYYFIRNIEYAAVNNAKISLELDVLNTYNNQFDFSPNTFVIREHIDRWNYSGLYHNKINDKLYLLRNFHKDEEENQLTENIYNGFLYCDNSDQYLDYNYWVKFKVRDEKEGLKIYFINLHYSFNIINGDESILIKGLTQYKPEELNIIIQNNNVILDMSIIPYPPHEAFKNVGLTDLYIDSLKFNDTFNVGYLTFKYNDISVVLIGIYTNLYTSLLPLQKLTLSLDKIANNSLTLSLSKLLACILIQRVKNATNLITQIKNNIIIKNGVFSSNYDEIRDINNFYDVNEPSALKNNYLNLNLNFLDYNNDILIENFQLIDKTKFNEICDNFENNNITIINMNYKLFYFNDGGAFYISNSDYFRYLSNNEIGQLVRFFSILPSLSNEAIEYEKNAELKRMENKTIFESVTDFLDDSRKFITKLPRQIKTGVRAGISTLVRTGSLGRAGISAGLGYLFTQEDENNRRNINNTSFEAAITKNEFKLQFTLKNNIKVNTVQDLYYHNGNLVNVNKIPTHNNRIFFDYLKCDPIFLKNITCSKEILDKIKDLFNEGVYYIHEFDQQFKIKTWIFPNEYCENFEIELINNL